jgi:streptogramin lyase
MAEDARVGTEIAGYRIDDVAGRGGMSVVYVAEDLRLGRRVALKILSSQLAEDERFRERFLRESRLAASIDHPNIVPIYDANEDDGTLFIAMRYVEGTDLHSLLRSEGRLEPSRAAGIVTQMAAALDVAHASGLVHRDVKPGNALLTPEDHVYLSDFGLTKRTLSVSGITETGQLIGTIDYVAPEQIRGDAVDARADVYSLGCIVYEVLTGRVPYPRDIELAVLWAHVQEPPPIVTTERPELPEAVDDVVAHAMAGNPDERTPTAGAVAAELRAALGLEEGAPLVRRRTARGGRHRRRELAAGAIGVVLLALAGAYLATRGSGAPQVPPVDTVARIDAEAHEFGQVVAVGADPTGLAAGDGSIWVINQTAGTVQRVDPQGGEAGSARSALGTPTGIAWGEGAVWITNGFGAEGVGSQVVRVDPADDSVQAAFETPGGKAIVVAYGSVWVADDNGDRVLRFDPSTGDLRAEVPMPEGSLPNFLAVGTGASEGIWVVNELGGTVVRIDPATENVTDRLPVDAPTAVAADDEGVWVTSNANDSVVRIDPRTGITRRTLSLDAGDGIPNGPTTILVTSSGVWVASNLDPIVVRLDPSTYEVVDRLEVGGIADGMTVDESGDVWISVHAP